MRKVGQSSAWLWGNIRNSFGNKVFDTFSAYSKEVFDRVKSPFTVTQGELWHDWLHDEADRMEFISTAPPFFFQKEANALYGSADRPRLKRDYSHYGIMAALAFSWEFGQLVSLSYGHSRSGYGHRSCYFGQGTGLQSLDVHRIKAGIVGRLGHIHWCGTISEAVRNQFWSIGGSI